MISNLIRRLKQGTEDETFGREILASFVSQCFDTPLPSKLRVLDIGCASGKDLGNVQRVLGPDSVELHGLECHTPFAQKARNRGISVSVTDIEREAFPFEDSFFDVIIANQVIEHTKEIFWIFSEVSRVLREGGFAIVGIPNLASLHNRVLLLGGKNPPTIEALGPHVRAFTKDSFVRFVSEGEYFRVLRVKGANFYPFPRRIARILAGLFPFMSVALFFLCERTSKSGRFLDVLEDHEFDSSFFTGT